jgi:hypothetical protein
MYEINNKHERKETRMKSRGKEDNLSCCFSNYPAFIDAGKKRKRTLNKRAKETDKTGGGRTGIRKIKRNAMEETGQRKNRRQER